MYKYQSSGSYGLLCFSKSSVQKHSLCVCLQDWLDHGQNWLDYPKINSISATFNLIVYKINSVQRIDLLLTNSPENRLDLLYCWSSMTHSVRGKSLKHNKLYKLPFAQDNSRTNTSEE